MHDVSYKNVKFAICISKGTATFHKKLYVFFFENEFLLERQKEDQISLTRIKFATRKICFNGITYATQNLKFNLFNG